MRPVALACTLFAAVISVAHAQEIELICNAGPVEQTFGGTPWVVFGCDDGKSLVVATTMDNPASPFMFVVAWGPHGYRVQGQGDGNQSASPSAFDELSAMSDEDFAALYSSTQRPNP